MSIDIESLKLLIEKKKALDKFLLETITANSRKFDQELEGIKNLHADISIKTTDKMKKICAIISEIRMLNKILAKLSREAEGFIKKHHGTNYEKS